MASFYHELIKHSWSIQHLSTKDWPGKKVTIHFPISFLVKSSEKILVFLPAFYQIIGLMKLPKSFEKIVILKI